HAAGMESCDSISLPGSPSCAKSTRLAATHSIGPSRSTGCSWDWDSASWSPFACRSIDSRALCPTSRSKFQLGATQVPRKWHSIPRSRQRSSRFRRPGHRVRRRRRM
ncbi:rabl3, partial [Symbiodinium microadriaticum]